jgi:succinate-semialdehyde dehydrogenase/glutarate-semialdehyde dehydrogenase
MTFESHNPATGQLIGTYPEHDEAETDLRLQAVELANSTDFGLGAAIWSRDLERANRLANSIECGMVFINDIVHSDPRAPFGGVKASGIGRELGVPGALELANPKLIWLGA